MSICDQKKCTACMSCYNACPKHCITMEYNGHGTLLPKVSLENCINCNICFNVCPVNNPVQKNEPLEAYACWDLDDKKRKSSSSGGISSIFYEHIIKNNGIVFGCNYDKHLQLKFSYSETLDQIQKYKTSKYSQSYIGNSFKEIHLFLQNNKKVLFIGTPCQVAGLKTYLGKDYDNLITVDLICHGVPSQKFIDEYIKSLHLKETPTDISFRGIHDFYFTLYKEQNILYSEKAKDDKYFSSFLNGLFYRENCYECPYATSSRVGDITIGDFWGLGKEIPFNHDTSLGVSVALINTNKGKELFENIKNLIFFEKREIAEAIDGNEQLKHPSLKNKNYDKFKKLYSQHGFEYALNECCKEEVI